MKVGKVRVKPKTIAIAAVAHKITATLRGPQCLNDKVTLLFELRQARRIRSHFHKEKGGHQGESQTEKQWHTRSEA